MLSSLFPNLYVKSIYDLPLNELKSNGIKALVFDIDNTVAPYDIAEPDERLIDYFRKLISLNYEIIILSNNNKKRVELFNKKLGVTAIYKAGKPGVKKLLDVLRIKRILPKEAALIGDQIFTDVLCGNRAGVVSILTAPICDRDQFVTKIKRGIEKQVLKIYFKKVGIKWNVLNM